MTKIINVSLARPGTGKTKTACHKVRHWVSVGFRVLIVVPTTSLADQICTDLSDINPWKIDHRGGFSPLSRLNKHLDPSEGVNLLICQQATFHQCEKKHLINWKIIIDELPTPVSPHAIKIRKSQLDNLPYIAIDQDRKLSIIENCKGKAQDWSRGSTIANGCGGPISIVSEDCRKIYNALINKHDVYVTDEGKTNNCIIYYSEEFDFFGRFEACSEVHILSATWNGSLFAWFSAAHGFTAEISELTPLKPEKHNQRITIYPMLQENQCSKRILNAESKLEVSPGELSLIRNIQLIYNNVEAAINEKDNCLLFVQEWANLKPSSKFIVCGMDSRGLNGLSGASNVLCISHGNHVTTATMCFKRLADKYGKSYESLRDAWTQTFLYDATLQNVYRCSLRDGKSMEPVALYVQTSTVADYLKEMYLHDATIDTRYVKEYCEPKKRGPKPNPQRDKAIQLLESGYTVTEVVAELKIPASTVKNYKTGLKGRAAVC